MPIENDGHYPGPSTILVDVGAARQGYGWIFPKQRCLSVGVGEFRRKSTSLRATFDRFIQGEPGLTGRRVPRPVGHPIPVFSEGDPEGSETRGLDSSVVGHCWLVMPPIWSIPCLVRVFIMPFVRGNWLHRRFCRTPTTTSLIGQRMRRGWIRTSCPTSGSPLASLTWSTHFPALRSNFSDVIRMSSNPIMECSRGVILLNSF